MSNPIDSERFDGIVIEIKSFSLPDVFASCTKAIFIRSTTVTKFTLSFLIPSSLGNCQSMLTPSRLYLRKNDVNDEINMSVETTLLKTLPNESSLLLPPTATKSLHSFVALCFKEDNFSRSLTNS